MSAQDRCGIGMPMGRWSGASDDRREDSAHRTPHPLTWYGSPLSALTDMWLCYNHPAIRHNIQSKGIKITLLACSRSPGRATAASPKTVPRATGPTTHRMQWGVSVSVQCTKYPHGVVLLYAAACQTLFFQAVRAMLQRTGSGDLRMYCSSTPNTQYPNAVRHCTKHARFG
jgi:hypothetical protein